MDVNGVAAIVTGGASGLGEATVRALRAGGAKVAIWDVNEAKGESLAAECGAVFQRTDVASEESVSTSLAAAIAANGPPRVLVNCAGIGPAEKIAGSKGPHALASFERTIRVNLIGSFNCCRLVAAAMRSNEPGEDGERGVLINTASIAGVEGQIGQVAYAASKGGILGMTLPIARDLAGDGIRCVAIMPGLFDTPLLATVAPEVRAALGAQVPFPRRLGDTSEFASLALEICRNRMMNGSNIRLDGAIRMAPR